ncbi:MULTISPECIES: sensor histidine kinase [Mesoflavibacter]|uniref:sensor histidine kinase n=1 Tax=Mesoflavibacter TaxID=444051 RepID=UPI0004099FBF|nr:MULTISPECIES: histidine kinase [Mesoflavibacter]MCP4054167.1 two-component sensor histidine kinase [Mesoflavibacter sp.]UAB75312.1 two-component sensor histidine kinase [Mesoflavibacter sp. SCSIO 43206]
MSNFIILLLKDPATSTAAERYLLIYMIFVLIAITSLVILFFIVFQKRKNKLLIDKIKQKQAFEKELSNAQTEIQEQTLKNIGWELHDNVGQLLAAASMQLNILKTKLDNDDVLNSFKDASDTVKESLKEVRMLSRSLNNEVILNIGFEKSISNELDRLKKMKFASAELNVKGDIVEFENKKHEIIIFRILQEFFSNTVKYSEAKNLSVILDYQENHLKIIAKDDGVGFDMTTVNKGAGLLNMQSRAELINMEYQLLSQPGDGVTLELLYPYKHDTLEPF